MFDMVKSSLSCSISAVASKFLHVSCYSALYLRVIAIYKGILWIFAMISEARMVSIYRFRYVDR